ncbi:MAG: hypothetical protein ACD_26C00068G0001, partial [uncultured bacterium]
QESELYYYNARYYNPRLGRFISRDPFLGRDGDTLSRNGYTYVKNNPLKYVDPSGEKDVCTIYDKPEPQLYWSQAPKNFSDYVGDAANFFNDVKDYNYQNPGDNFLFQGMSYGGGFISGMVGGILGNVSTVTDPYTDRWEKAEAGLWLGVDAYTFGRGSTAKEGIIKGTTEILYHGTTKNRATEIAKNGFKVIDDIFTSKEWGTAIRFAEDKTAEMAAKSSAIVKVSVPKTVFESLKSGGHIIEQAIEPFGDGMTETILSPTAVKQLNELKNSVGSGVEYLINKIW